MGGEQGQTAAVGHVRQDITPCDCETFGSGVRRRLIELRASLLLERRGALPPVGHDPPLTSRRVLTAKRTAAIRRRLNDLSQHQNNAMGTRSGSAAFIIHTLQTPLLESLNLSVRGLGLFYNSFLIPFRRLRIFDVKYLGTLKKTGPRTSREIKII